LPSVVMGMWNIKIYFNSDHKDFALAVKSGMPMEEVEKVLEQHLCDW
jgi:hypothetical protein